jgi:hypothetical protein
MLNKHTRAILFISACIPVRFAMVYLARKLPLEYLQYFGLVVLAMATGTLYLFFTNGRMNAAEGGGKTWWAPFRGVHGMLLLAAAVYLLREKRNAMIPLLLDVIIGMIFFTFARD